MLRRLSLGLGAAALALSLGASTALAANPSGTGQPSTSCDDFGPGPAGFNTAGFANAALLYANPDATGGVMSGNWRVVSQYVVACYQLATH